MLAIEAHVEAQDIRKGMVYADYLSDDDQDYWLAIGDPYREQPSDILYIPVVGVTIEVTSSLIPMIVPVSGTFKMHEVEDDEEFTVFFHASV